MYELAQRDRAATEEMAPAVTDSRPLIRWNKVDLPAPFGPMMA